MLGEASIQYVLRMLYKGLNPTKANINILYGYYSYLIETLRNQDIYLDVLIF